MTTAGWFGRLAECVWMCYCYWFESRWRGLRYNVTDISYGATRSEKVRKRHRAEVVEGGCREAKVVLVFTLLRVVATSRPDVSDSLFLREKGVGYCF